MRIATYAALSALFSLGAGCEDDDVATGEVADELIEERASDDRADEKEADEGASDLAEREEPGDIKEEPPAAAKDAEPAAPEDVETLSEPEAAMELVKDRWLAKEILKELSLRELSILRNAPFARAGQEFRTPWLAAYFWRDPKVYEPGDFDEDAVTELEAANSRQVRAFEAGMTEAERKERWNALWDDLGEEPPGDEPWHWPEPWQRDIESRIEARLLAEALERPHPPDPLFDEGATRPLPRDLGGIELGDPKPDDLEHAFSRRQETIEFLDADLEVGVREEGGEVADVAAGEFHHPHDGRPIESEIHVESFERQLTAIFGEPDERAVHSAWPPHDEPIWRADDRVLELGYLVKPEEAGPAMLLRPADPGRPCGPEDGFARTLEGIARGFDAGDFDAVMEHVADPLVGQGVVYSEGGELSEDELEKVPFDEVHPLKDAFSVDEHDGTMLREGRRGCAPLSGKHVASGMGHALSPVFGADEERRWYLGAIREHVPGYLREPGEPESALAEICPEGDEPCPCPDYLRAPGEFEVSDWQYAFLSDPRQPDLLVSIAGCGHDLEGQTLVFTPDPQTDSGWRPVELPLVYRLGSCEPHDIGGGREALGCATGRTHMGQLKTHGAALAYVDGEFALVRVGETYSELAGVCHVPGDELRDEALRGLRLVEVTPERASLELEIGRAELDVPEEHDGDLCAAEKAGWDRPDLEEEVESVTVEDDEIVLESEHAASRRDEGGDEGEGENGEQG